MSRENKNIDKVDNKQGCPVGIDAECIKSKCIFLNFRPSDKEAGYVLSCNFSKSITINKCHRGT